MRSQRASCLVAILLPALFAGEGFAVTSQPADLPGLDPVSAGCVTCHNGSEGSHAGFCLLSQGGKKADGHVISASYAEFAKRNQEIRPINSLPPEIALHDGKITCVTCHGGDPHNSATLAVDNIGSALCRACHLK